MLFVPKALTETDSYRQYSKELPNTYRYIPDIECHVAGSSVINQLLEEKILQQIN